MTGFWLSHHTQEELGRTYRVGGVHVCARCLGTYPVLALTLAAQLVLRRSGAWREDVPASLLLTLPALVDWAVGRFRPWSGTNAVRTLTGVLLGLSLGRTLYLHLLHPFPRPLLLQAALVTTVAVPVMFLSRPRLGP